MALNQSQGPYLPCHDQATDRLEAKQLPFLGHVLRLNSKHASKRAQTREEDSYRMLGTTRVAPPVVVPLGCCNNIP